MLFCLHVSYLRFNGRFPSEPALGGLPSVFFLLPLPVLDVPFGISGAGFYGLNVLPVI